MKVYELYEKTKGVLPKDCYFDINGLSIYALRRAQVPGYYFAKIVDVDDVDSSPFWKAVKAETEVNCERLAVEAAVSGDDRKVRSDKYAETAERSVLDKQGDKAAGQGVSTEVGEARGHSGGEVVRESANVPISAQSAAAERKPKSSKAGNTRTNKL